MSEKLGKATRGCALGLIELGLKHRSSLAVKAAARCSSSHILLLVVAFIAATTVANEGAWC